MIQQTIFEKVKISTEGAMVNGLLVNTGLLVPHIKLLIGYFS